METITCRVTAALMFRAIFLADGQIRASLNDMSTYVAYRDAVDLLEGVENATFLVACDLFDMFESFAKELAQ